MNKKMEISLDKIEEQNKRNRLKNNFKDYSQIKNFLKICFSDLNINQTLSIDFQILVNEINNFIKYLESDDFMIYDFKSSNTQTNDVVSISSQSMKRFNQYYNQLEGINSSLKINYLNKNTTKKNKMINN